MTTHMIVKRTYFIYNFFFTKLNNMSLERETVHNMHLPLPP